MAKTATFGVLHLLTSFSVTYTLTGSLTIAGAVTFVEPVLNTVMHYFFDKYWDHPKALRARRMMARTVSGVTPRIAAQMVAETMAGAVPQPVAATQGDHFSTKARSMT